MVDTTAETLQFAALRLIACGNNGDARRVPWWLKIKG